MSNCFYENCFIGHIIMQMSFIISFNHGYYMLCLNLPKVFLKMWK